MNEPKEGAKRWLARMEADGSPWSPGWGDAQIFAYESGTSEKLPIEDLKRIWSVLYPDKKDRGKHRRFLTPAEAQEALRAAHAEINGEPPHAISMLMKLDIDNLTPVQALSTLKHLQDVARRRDIGPRLFDGPEGG